MNTEALQRPTGFAPQEISALVNREVVSQHAEEAAFLWTLRNRAISEPHYSLKDLVVLDDRLEAHLNGLRVAGDVGWDFCKGNLVNEGPGEVFALAVLAFGSGSRDRMREALNAGCASSKLRPGLVSALGWLDYVSVSEWLRRLLEARAPLHRTIGVGGCAIHREDPGAVLRAAVDDADPVLRARALRCAGEGKRHDLLESIRTYLQDENEACRFWAAWTVTLLGASEGVPILMRFVEQNAAYAERALRLVLRAIGLTDSRRWVSSLAREPEFARLVAMGAGIVGDPVSVPWLIKRMESPELARLAGEAFAMITGVDLAYQDLAQDAPSGPAGDEPEELALLDYESNLSWPSAPLVAQWWKKNEHAFPPGMRYLGGKPITAQSAIEVLVNGKQRLRSAAAFELALLNPSDVLFEVRARGSQQEKKLAAWTS
jgi:uncharacterized protein (TIGR02270 family)